MFPLDDSLLSTPSSHPTPLLAVAQGEFEITNTRVNLRRAIGGATELVAPQVESKGLRLSVSVDDATVPREALLDALRLRQGTQRDARMMG